MTLTEYFDLPDSLSVAQLRMQIGAKSDVQIRQWQHGYAGRKPGPGYCAAIERATRGQVTRQDLRPADFWRIWPDLTEPAAA